MFVKHGDKQYNPRLFDGLLDLRTAVAYGPAGQHKFLLTAYCACVPRNAGTRPPVGGYKNDPLDMAVDVPVWREHVDHATSEADQLQKLEFACNIFATKMGLDYRLRLPHVTKPTPKSYYKRRLT